MKTSFRRWITRAVIGIILAGVVVSGLIAYGYPAIAAAICPSCYGMKHAEARLIVDPAMPLPLREQLSKDVTAAESMVRSFYGTFNLAPIIVACSTAECDRRMGGRGALATTVTTPFAIVTRVSPRGLNSTILAHEFSLVELHRQIGWWKLINGAVPVWFDEGVAVIVSDDDRYLKPGTTATERCIKDGPDSLPSSFTEWGRRAGNDRMIYAQAACRVLRWMEANDGRDGLLRTIDATARGGTFNP